MLATAVGCVHPGRQQVDGALDGNPSKHSLAKTTNERTSLSISVSNQHAGLVD